MRRLEGDLLTTYSKSTCGRDMESAIIYGVSTECALLVVWCGWVASFWDRESDGCCQLSIVSSNRLLD